MTEYEKQSILLQKQTLETLDRIAFIMNNKIPYDIHKNKEKKEKSIFDE